MYFFQVVGLVRRDQTLILATMDSSLVNLSLHGRRLWRQTLPAAAICLEAMDLHSRGLSLVAVAMDNKQVLVFNDKQVVDSLR